MSYAIQHKRWHPTKRARQRYTAPCADCGVDTYQLREYYMVHTHVWKQAWVGYPHQARKKISVSLAWKSG